MCTGYFLSVWFDGQGFNYGCLAKGFALLLNCLSNKVFGVLIFMVLDRTIAMLLFLSWFALSYLENLIDRMLRATAV